MRNAFSCTAPFTEFESSLAARSVGVNVEECFRSGCVTERFQDGLDLFARQLERLAALYGSRPELLEHRLAEAGARSRPRATRSGFIARRLAQSFICSYVH